MLDRRGKGWISRYCCTDLLSLDIVLGAYLVIRLDGAIRYRQAIPSSTLERFGRTWQSVSSDCLARISPHLRRQSVVDSRKACH